MTAPGAVCVCSRCGREFVHIPTFTASASRCWFCGPETPAGDARGAADDPQAVPAGGEAPRSAAMPQTEDEGASAAVVAALEVFAAALAHGGVDR